MFLLSKYINSLLIILLTMDKHFNHKTEETKIYQEWLDCSVFTSQPDNRPPFTILQPPPNLTGVLHIGHALNCTLQDILIRYHKLKGSNTLWIPGTDHAGIATQSVVEKELLKSKINRRDIGREKFIEKVHEWKDQKHKIIIEQFKKLGCSFDWSREQFTMNDHFSQLVLDTFTQLYHDGLIYKGKYIVNWCKKCGTALSDDEVENFENHGKMYYLRYKFVDDPDNYIVIATTRPETIFGDVAIAYHPSDELYNSFVGKKVIVPIINREIPLIADHNVEKDFGTGLVKITPAHDKNDYNMGKTHNLEFIQIINQYCKIENTGTKYDGMDRMVCRQEILKELQELGSIDKIENYKNNIGQCYRCQTIIEPLLSNQWFVKMT